MSNKSQPDISIIIVSYNSWAVLPACLEAIAATRGSLTVETLVVDNGSDDGTAANVRAGFPWATVIDGHGNVGFAGGNNIGFAAASGRYLFMLNPDTEVRDGALETLLTYGDAHPDVGMIAPQMVYPDGALQHNTFKFPDMAQAVYGFFERLVPLDSLQNGRYLPQDYERVHEVEHILGAAVFVRRAVYETLGGMDEDYALYFEETDWCFRVKQAGWQLQYIPTATIMHIGAHSTSKNPERSSVLFAQSQARFYRRNRGLVAYVMLKVITVVGLAYWLARTLWGWLRGRVDSATVQRRVASYRGILRA